MDSRTAAHVLSQIAAYLELKGENTFKVRAYESACRDHAPAEIAPALRHELQRELADIRDVLDEAYEVLRDDALRSAYLAHLPT